MRIEVNLRKRHLFAFVLILSVFGALFFAYAYGSVPANPPVFGHTASETDAGNDITFGGTSTFKAGPGGAAEFFFPKILGVAGRDPGFRSFYVTNYSSGGVTRIGVAGSSSGGSEGVDFIHDGVVKANAVYLPGSNSLDINDFSAGTPSNTVINRNSGNVGIGMDPTSSYKLAVNGYVRAVGPISSTSDIFSAASVRAQDLCVNAFDPGTGINVATNANCVHGIPLQNNIAVNAVTLTSGQVRTNNNRAALFFTANSEPPENGWVNFDLKSSAGSWFTYASMTKAGSGGYGRSPQMTGFVPPGYSYRMVSSDGITHWGNTFETTFG